MNKVFEKLTHVTSEIVAYAIILGTTLGSIGFVVVVIKWFLGVLGVI